MEIKTLKSFVTVAALKNFSAAARELHTVQPAISRHISDLEEELGVRLFWRNTREVKITAAGQSLLRDAHDILAREALAKEQTKRAAQGQIGRLRIGYLQPACFSFLPWLIQQYSSNYPEVQIKLQEMTVREQFEALTEDHLDVGFSRPLPKSEQKGISAKEIYTDTLIAVIPETHPLATSKNLRLRDLSGDSFILFKRKEAIGLFDKIITACQEEDFAPNISSQPITMQTVLTKVASGLGVSIMPGCVGHLYTNGCVLLPIQGQTPSIPTEMHYREDPLPPTVERFVELVVQVRNDLQELAVP